MGPELFWVRKNSLKLQPSLVAYCPNVPTTPITAMGYGNVYALVLSTLKVKHCQKPHCHNGVVDRFWHCCVDLGPLIVKRVNNFVTFRMLRKSIAQFQNYKFWSSTHLFKEFSYTKVTNRGSGKYIETHILLCKKSTFSRSKQIIGTTGFEVSEWVAEFCEHNNIFWRCHIITRTKITSKVPLFWCVFFAAGSWEKDTENRAAVMSLKSFLFRDDFS